MKRAGTGNLEVTITVNVEDLNGRVIGRETHSLVLPVGDYAGSPDLEAQINTIAETQPIAADLAKQCALSAMWKGARLLQDERPIPDELMPPVEAPEPDSPVKLAEPVVLED